MEVAIEFEVECKGCSTGLTAEFVDDGALVVGMCDNCKEEIQEESFNEGKEEGLDEGHTTGYHKGQQDAKEGIGTC